jgi:hypothetical protein
MPTTKTTALLPDVPPSAELRMRLAHTLTEAGLLKTLLQLALRREREAERLGRVAKMLEAEATTHAE